MNFPSAGIRTETPWVCHLEKLPPPKDALPECESKSAKDNQTVSLFSLDPDRFCEQRTKRRAGGGNAGLPGRAVRVVSQASPRIQCISTLCAEALRRLNAFRDRFLIFIESGGHSAAITAILVSGKLTTGSSWLFCTPVPSSSSNPVTPAVKSWERPHERITERNKLKKSILWNSAR